jgi:hypothetical protein
MSVSIVIYLSGKDIHTLRAVVLLIRFAVVTLQARPDLCTDTNSVTDLDSLDIVADLDSPADDLVANAQRHRSVSPAACTVC